MRNPIPAIAKLARRTTESVRMQVYEEPMLVIATMALLIMVGLILPAAETSAGSSQLQGAAAAIGNGASLSGGILCAIILVVTPLVNLFAALRQAWLAIGKNSTEVSAPLYVALAANLAHMLVVGNALKVGWAIGPVGFTGIAIPLTILAVIAGIIFSYTQK